MIQWIEDVEASLRAAVDIERQENARREVQEGESFLPDTFATERLEVFRRLRESPEAETVWRALERRSDSGVPTQGELAYQRGVESAERLMATDGALELPPQEGFASFCEGNQGLRRPRQSRTHHVFDLATSLIGAVAQELGEEVPQDNRSARRKRLARVEKAATQLIREIRMGEAPKEMYLSIAASLQETAHEYADDHIRVLTSLWNVKPPTDAELAIAERFATVVTRYPEPLIRAIVQGVERWSEARVEVARPGAPNARRLLFVRRLTQFFLDELDGEPLRNVVAIITRQFFPDSESLDYSVVQKLAPIEKRHGRWRVCL